MTPVDAARRALQLAAREYLEHVDSCAAKGSCSHAPAVRYAAARANCQRLEQQLLESWSAGSARPRERLERISTTEAGPKGPGPRS